jgi:aminoglycoside phosphotransferase (APT) family kinase protein
VETHRQAEYACDRDSTAESIQRMRPQELEALERDARRELGARRVEVAGELTGGASRRLWAFDACLEDASRVPLVLLRTAGTAEREWQALRLAHRHGVPVAEPLWRTPDGDGIVLRRVAGEAIARRILRDEQYASAREGLLAELAAAAAGIHGLPVERAAGIPAAARPGAVAELDAIEAELDRYDDPHPVLELGLRWLRANVPAPRRPAVVHGDFRLGNLLVGEHGLAAVLDWELVHVGDPVEDLGWMCIRSWRFGADDRPAAGLGSRRELLRAYRAAGGPAVEPEELRFWETLGNLRWGVLCLRQLHAHLSGRRPSLELAAIGRRACEVEWDLLAMID